MLAGLGELLLPEVGLNAGRLRQRLGANHRFGRIERRLGIGDHVLQKLLGERLGALLRRLRNLLEGLGGLLGNAAQALVDLACALHTVLGKGLHVLGNPHVLCGLDHLLGLLHHLLVHLLRSSVRSGATIRS